MRIDRAGLPFVAILAVALAASLVWAPGWAPLPGILLAFTLWFFRDPDRDIPSGPGVVVSPADGRVIVASPERISVFLNIFNVHVCRAPVAGRVIAVRRVPGRFLAAFREEASEQNERTTIEIESTVGIVRVTLVAGLVARRIVCRVTTGDTLDAGQRMGIIRFGSRVDVDSPGGASTTVAVGDRVRAGASVIARVDPPRSERVAPAAVS